MRTLVVPLVGTLALLLVTPFASAFIPRQKLLIKPSTSIKSSSSNSTDGSISNGRTNTRWTESSRWEQNDATRPSSTGPQFLLKEKFGTYFKVPNPATLMTKIICTIGPNTMSPTMLGKLMDAGMSAARINMSHGSFDYMEEFIDNVRAVAKARNKLCPIILDTKGPEIRVKGLTLQKKSSPEDNGSTMPLQQMTLESGNGLILLTGSHSDHTHSDQDVEMAQDFLVSPPPMDDAYSMDSKSTKTTTSASSSSDTIVKAVTVTYPYMANAVKIGDVVLLDDGRISLIVTKVPNDQEVHTQVIEGGMLKINKGVNLPGCHVDLPHLTEKDIEDILFGVSKNVEYIAHSFTRSASGINQVRELPGVVESGTHIIAKIESQEGLDNFESILRVSDGIMVARGDLGVEIPLERVCSVQKRLVASCNAVGKPVIVATELLDSMINHPRPTRAEASDVANAVFDGADCVMLSGETAVGKYPIESIQVMTRICKEAELDVASSLRAMAALDGTNGKLQSTASTTKSDRGAIRDAFAKSAIAAARETSAELIIAITRTGLTANALAKFFSSVPVMVLSTSEQVCAQVLLHRSVTPYLVQSLNRESCIPRAVSKAMELGLVEPGSRVLLLTGPNDMIANRLETFVVGEAVLPPPPMAAGNYSQQPAATEEKSSSTEDSSVADLKAQVEALKQQLAEREAATSKDDEEVDGEETGIEEKEASKSVPER